MPIHPRAGERARTEDLIDVEALISAYFENKPDPAEPGQRVAFGTSGHRGSSTSTSFNEAHILAVSQALCEYRAGEGVAGPLFLGRDTHALSDPAAQTALEVFAANDVTVLVDNRDGFTPTPALSHAILTYNAGRGGNGKSAQADGVVITPSHNPPGDGGYKYNPPHGGPADSDATRWIENRANELLTDLGSVKRIPYERAVEAETTQPYDYRGSYIGDLPAIVDLDQIRNSGIRIGADPLGGASVDYWAEIAARHGISLTVVQPEVDPAWGFMTLDWDGKIRMDCSSAYAMASLVDQRANYDLATGNDPDADRHGIVTPDAGLMNPNHFLAVAIDYLVRHRPSWPAGAGIGKTVVSSSMIDRVVADLDRPLVEVPVGFKWFVPGLVNSSILFGGEESAGASFLRKDGKVWTTDKDGIVLCLLAAEILAGTGRTPSQHYTDLTAKHGEPVYERTDAPATREEKHVLAQLSPHQVTATELAGEPITAILTEAPGNGKPIGGLKVCTDSGWFAARPSGTEDVYKIYAESFKDRDHLSQIQAEARAVVSAALGGK
ncbi:phosphoglucomutase (alpha-D-glucose-1,6-bisphosphate-dependent) [Hoyosella subflava]|uniref:Putative phosphoglucomutase n=1 Tax=Hoyosella subflava (strain DSM 45089 / JCM 17490 / NBRC 109087 / DQS3-9A1) TaxID=443218 RepID=F6EFH8_HOYSD|nr:phosphoglucomutase (alpha-D-glucose-1,6-bisphosphate-dependent) [Hoyosella subflava]AEF39791.1 Putative phosphoglucomutase [Hoyosella subflava DQS3-9A1]